jgi:hypothetical protein
MSISALPDEPYQLSPKAAKAHKALNAAIAALTAEQDQHRADDQALQSIDAESITPADVERAQQLRTKRAELMRREIDLRRRVDAEWYACRRRERDRATDEATAATRAAIDDVREKLRSIGFDVDGSIDVGGVRLPAVPELVYHRHPSVTAAATALEALTSLRSEDGDEVANRRAIDQLAATLAKIMREALAGVS